MLGLRASLRRGSTALSLVPRVNAHTRSNSTQKTPQQYTIEEERGTIKHPYTAGHQVWNKEMLRNLNMASISELKSPLQPRTYKNIYDLPTVQELAEVGRAENPWGRINKDKEFFDTWQVSNPTVPESAETAPSLVSSVLRHDGTCKRFEMNRTEALNALDVKFTSEIRKLIQQWDDAPGILTFMGHTVIPGAMFCPGSDLKAILKAGRGSKYLREFYHDTLASVISSTKKPAFMVLDGPVFGNGSAFLTGQFTTTTMRTVLAVPDVLIGFFPDGGILAKLGEIGRYIALTGRRINYSDLHNLGLAKYHIDTSGEVEGVQTAMGLLAHDDVYRTQVIFSSLPIEAPEGEGTLEAVGHLIQRVFKKKSVSLMMKELQKIIEEPETTNGEGAVEWAARTLRRMKKASPVSLCVTLEYLKLAARNQMSLEDCLAMDFRLSQRFVETDDYWNGIQVACERNRSASWSYKSVEDVPSSVVQEFFRPFEDPRMEFRPVISRPKENTPDWNAYYNDFTDELTIPAPRPRIFNADGSLSLARVPIPEEKLTKEQLRAIPTTDDLYDQVAYWLTIVNSLNDAIRYEAFEANLPELISLFKTSIISDCFSILRKYVMDSTEVPSLMLNHANDIVLNIQAIMIGSEGPHKSTVEFIASVKDVLPILYENLRFFYDFLTPAKIPADFEEDVATLALQAYDRGLVEDVDYVSV